MKRLLVLVLAVALSGCAGYAGIAALDRDGFTPDQYELAVSDGSARAVVRNNPFVGDTDDRGVIEAFSGRANPPLPLAKTPPDTRRYDYRVVIQFGDHAYAPSVAGGFVATCDDRARARALPAEGPWPFRVAFCNGQRAISEAYGFFPRSASPDSPEFRRAAAIVMTALTYPNVPNMKHGNDGDLRR
jgi:hypothetical protein